MAEDIAGILNETKKLMEKAIEHMNNEFSKVRAGKASPEMLGVVFVDYYGASTPLAQVANINTPDARTLVIQPWEKAMLTPIEKGIAQSNLGFNPMNDGQIIRITIPPLTEERRKQLVKQAKEVAEDGKVAVRNLRKDANENVKRLVKAGLPEDEGKVGETKIQELTDKFGHQIDELFKEKEKDILTV